MPGPLRLAAAALELGLVGAARQESRAVTSLALILLGLVCATAGGGFGVSALLIYLIPIVGPAAACLIVAGALVALACVALASSHYLSRRPRNGQAPPQLDFGSLAAGAEGFVRENKALSLAAAFVAGLLVADERSRRE